MTRPQVERAMTREELMAMRAEAEKHWRAGRTALDAVVPGPLSLSPGEEKILAAYLDANVGPLPAPEPQQVTGPSGTVYALRSASHPESVKIVADNQLTDLWVARDDLPTIANLLVPFEDVVRATLEEMGVSQIVAGPAWEPSKSFCARVATIAPAILKRLESR